MRCFLLIGLSLAASTARAVDFELLPYSAEGYRFASVRFDGRADFAHEDFDFSDFGESRLPMGTKTGCPLNANVSTDAQVWPGETDLLIVRPLYLFPGVTALRVLIAVDDRAQVFFNGVDVSGMRAIDFCPSYDSLSIPVPDELLRYYPEVNTLKVRARDLGGANYFDLRVLAASQARVAASAWP
jgi:hypothetical protein